MVKKKELIVLIIGISIYCLAASLVSLNRFWQGNAFWYDFGILDTTIWKLSRFQLPYIEQLKPPTGLVVWGDHVNPSIIFYAPVYWLTNRPEATLIVQTIAVGISGLIGYILARKITKSILISVALLVSYLGFVGIQNALFTDIHNIVFSLPFLMLTFYAVWNRQWRLYWISLIIFLGFQESLAGIGLGIGLYLLLRKDKHIATGIVTILLSVVWAIVTTKIISPYFYEATYKYAPLIPATPVGWIKDLLLPPIKAQSIFLTFATFGFLPLASIATLPMILENFIERFILNSAATRWDLGMHYNAILAPIFLTGALETIYTFSLLKWKKIIKIWAIATIGIVFFIHRFYLHGPLLLATHPVFYEDTKKAESLRGFINKIPRDRLLMTQNNIASFFTHDKVILLSHNFEVIKPDYIALDIRPGQNGNNFFPIADSFDEFVASVSSSPNYKLKEISDSQLLYIRQK